MKAVTLALLCLLALIAVSEAGLGCDICTSLVSGLEKELQQGEGSDVDKANKFCDKLTKNNNILDSICKSIVDTSIEDIIDGIEKKDPPQVICKKIHMC